MYPTSWEDRVAIVVQSKKRFLDKPVFTQGAIKSRERTRSLAELGSVVNSAIRGYRMAYIPDAPSPLAADNFPPSSDNFQATQSWTAYHRAAILLTQYGKRCLEMRRTKDGFVGAGGRAVLANENPAAQFLAP